MNVGRLGLALERAQRLARLALDVQRAVQVVLRALELELRAAAALAVLAEAGRLLDEQAAIARRGENDLLDAALADHRVHLAAEVGVGEDLDDVGEPRACTVDPVRALSPALEAARDRDLGEVGVVGAIRVEHHLDLGVARRANALAARVDHVLHRLAANRERALLAERPEDGVGDVRLAAAVRANDHADARREDEIRPLSKGLEALDVDRAQMHGWMALRSEASLVAIGRLKARG